MPGNVELYDGAYGNYDSDVYRQVRIETYGEDFGQTSWVTTQESEEIPRWLALTGDSSVLEIGCGSGAYALHIAQEFGCHIIGLDINELGIRTANQLAMSGMAQKVRFEVCDASQALPFADATFDAFRQRRFVPHPRQAVSSLRNIPDPEAGRGADAIQ